MTRCIIQLRQLQFHLEFLHAGRVLGLIALHLRLHIGGITVSIDLDARLHRGVLKLGDLAFHCQFGLRLLGISLQLHLRFLHVGLGANLRHFDLWCGRLWLLLHLLLNLLPFLVGVLDA